MKPLPPHQLVADSGYMGNRVKDRYLEALRLLNLSDLARVTGRGYATLKAYRSGRREITEAAVMELVKYLQDRSEEYSAAAVALAAALEEEERDA